MIMGERVPPKTENFYTQNQEKIGRDDPPSKNQGFEAFMVPVEDNFTFVFRKSC